MSTFEELLDLFLPTRCAVCRSRGASICSTCFAIQGWQPRQIRRGDLPGIVVSEYGPVERDLIKAFKENGQTALLPFLCKPMVPALHGLVSGVGNPLIVPIPSSRSNYLKRGFVPAALLAKKLNVLAQRPARVKQMLGFNRTVADQSQLDVKARHLNLFGSISASAGLSGRSIVLIDDIVTSGATVLEASRAASHSGAKVLGFLAFSETILKTQPET
jgi:predicted amidophosphoribosyltransferase